MNAVNPLYVAHLQERLTQCNVPATLHDGLARYIGERRPVGQFLSAVLQNDLTNACRRADEDNLPQLHRIVSFLVSHAPSDCWGSPEIVSAWLNDPTPAPEVWE